MGQGHEKENQEGVIEPNVGSDHAQTTNVEASDRTISSIGSRRRLEEVAATPVNHNTIEVAYTRMRLLEIFLLGDTKNLEASHDMPLRTISELRSSRHPLQRTLRVIFEKVDNATFLTFLTFTFSEAFGFLLEPFIRLVILFDLDGRSIAFFEAAFDDLEMTGGPQFRSDSKAIVLKTEGMEGSDAFGRHGAAFCQGCHSV